MIPQRSKSKKIEEKNIKDYYDMRRFDLPVIQSYKAPNSDREVQLRLYNHIYIFTTTVGTQTDPEVFFMNGKPARAVQPFRVVPNKPREIVSQMAELELAISGQSISVNNTQAVTGAEHMTARPPAPMEEQQYQEVAASLPEQPEQPEEQDMSDAPASGSVMQGRVSQETQTDAEEEGNDTVD